MNALSLETSVLFIQVVSICIVFMNICSFHRHLCPDFLLF